MNRSANVIGRAWFRMPRRWWVRAIYWLVTAGVSRLVILAPGLLASNRRFLQSAWGLSVCACLQGCGALPLFSRPFQRQATLSMAEYHPCKRTLRNPHWDTLNNKPFRQPLVAVKSKTFGSSTGT